MKKFTITLILIFPLFTFGQIIHIPSDYSNIQQGINAASNGDTVLVDTGTYYENINFNGKAITVSSHFLIDKDSMYIINTIINGSQPANPDRGSVVMFESGEDTTSLICGFTITGGTGTASTYDNNEHRWGGGITFLNSGGKVLNNIIEGNSCIIDEFNGMATGGGIGTGPPNTTGFVVIRNNAIKNNLVWTKRTSEDWNLGWAQGAGVFMCFSSDISSNIISNNSCRSDSTISVGGAVRLWNNINQIFVNFFNNTINNNESISISSQAIAGGISCSAANTNIINNFVERNYTSGGTFCLGSGLYFDLANEYYANILNNVISENYFISGNSIGGGIGFFRSDSLNFCNNLIVNNFAVSGGAISFQASNPQSISNNTIVSNSADQLGGAVYIWDGSDIQIFNSILINDSANGVHNEIELENGSSLTMNYSNIEGNWSGPGTNNIDEDPLFINFGNYPYQIGTGSPCIDFGTPDTTGLYLPDYDQAGLPRIYNNRVDIGAYEWNPSVHIGDFLTNNSNSTIFIYPNPSYSNITIKLPTQPPQNTTLTISNINGQQLITQPITKPQTEIDISSLPAGIYIVKVWNDKEVVVQKVIKQ